MSTICFMAMKIIILLSAMLSTESLRSRTLSRPAKFLRNLQPLYSSNRPGSTGTIMTLSRFMIEATRSNPDHADFESLMASIQIACKTIAHLVSRAGICDLTGLQANAKAVGTGRQQTNFQTLVQISHVLMIRLL